MEYQPHSIGSDRLRKAIERNRAKQVKRSQRTSPPPRPTITRNTRSTRTATSAVSRRTVAKPETVEFGPINRSKTSKALTSVTYRKTPTKRARKAPVKITVSEKWQSIFTKVMWAICGVLLVRLIFSNGGVMDYYSRVSSFEQKQSEYNKIISQNKAIIAEIKKIKTNKSYQKKLVRDNLGLIATDEYLVVFP